MVENAKKNEKLREVRAPEIIDKIQKGEPVKCDHVSRRFDIAATIIVFLVFLLPHKFFLLQDDHINLLIYLWI